MSNWIFTVAIFVFNIGFLLLWDVAKIGTFAEGFIALVLLNILGKISMEAGKWKESGCLNSRK